MSTDAGERVTLASRVWSSVARRVAEDPEFARALEDPDRLAAISSGVVDSIAETAPAVLDTVLESAAETLAANREMRHEFEQRVEDVWGAAIDLFELFIGICLEVGDDFNRRLKDLPERDDDHSFDAVVRLHARSCLVAREVLTLIRAGYASGAHSRWRTLHELSVAARFIHEHGDDIALRYLEHDDIERYKAAVEMQTHAGALGEVPPTAEEMAALAGRRKELRLKYGKDFLNDFGWAAPAVGDGGRRFAEIEAATNLGHLRPYYRVASHAIHANSRGSFVDIGLAADSEDTLLAGPSTAGFSDPAISACISLFDCTCQFLEEEPDLDEVLAIRVLEGLLAKVTDAFHAAHDEHDLKASRRAAR